MYTLAFRHGSQQITETTIRLNSGYAYTCRLCNALLGPIVL